MNTQAQTARSTWLFAGTMLLSAWLVFLIQPMLGRMILPKLGGAASVWITVSLFFQIALLAGYLYAHVISARLKPRVQMAVHAVLALAAIFLLPLAIPQSWVPPADRSPQAALILMMAMTVGLPFVVVSATAPLLQRWYSLTGAADAGDPYYLYAASNLGSLAALILYPTLVEPGLGLAAQSWFWSGGFLLLLLALVACGWTTTRQMRPDLVPAQTGADADAAPSWKRRLHWLALAAVPSSLFLAVTLQISTDIASVPLLWLLPLTVYLLTFIIAFARRPLISRQAASRAIPYTATIAVLAAGLEASIGLPQILIAVILLFCFALSCHSELVALRPSPLHLTEFFLIMALGGALGGAFNALLAPLIFPDVYEYPIAVFGAIVLWAISRPESSAWPQSRRRRHWAWIMAAMLLFILLRLSLTFAALQEALLGMLAVKVVAALLCFSLRRKPLAMAWLAAGVLAAGVSITPREIARHRGFFGIHRIELGPISEAIYLLHGSTKHGGQFLDPASRREPLLYYARRGPVGQAFDALHVLRRPISPVGIIGLGAGTMACYAEKGEDWTFFEIDPTILATARDPNYFTYLAECAPDARIVLGDGRLKLGDEPDGFYRLLALDAFGSDSIPVHLLTREAIALYFKKLQPDGVLLVHISNRNVDLLPVLARLAEDAQLAGRTQYFPGVRPVSLFSNSEWVVLARNDADLGVMAIDPLWQRLPAQAPGRVWTDDYVDILSVIRWPWEK